VEHFAISPVGAGIMRRRSTRALCWHGKGDVRVDTVPDPKIQHPRDAVIKITACAICGSDLHLLDGYQPTMGRAATSSVTKTWAR
jgi:threonine dehydrogenase-like Zn-dependent dehydrogenase